MMEVISFHVISTIPITCYLLPPLGRITIINKVSDSGSSDNTNVESRGLSVVKYVINNIMSTALTGRRKTATYLHLVRELLYNIDWPSGRLLTYWHFVRVYAFCARVTYIL